MRVISIESDKQRLGLSLKEVTQEEKERWQQAKAEAKAEVKADDSVPTTDPVELEQQAE